MKRFVARNFPFFCHSDRKSFGRGVRKWIRVERMIKLINVTRATIPNNEQSRNRRVRIKLVLFYRVFSVARRWMSSTMRNGDAFSVFCSESRAGQGRRDKTSKKEGESETSMMNYIFPFSLFSNRNKFFSFWNANNRMLRGENFTYENEFLDNKNN